MASFQAAVSPRPRGGLAIGRARGPADEEIVELRVRASSGAKFERAEAIADLARQRGRQVRLVVQGRPSMPVARAAGQAGLPVIGQRCRPLHIGASIAHFDAPGAGSLGAFVRLPDGNAGILSCSHVLARRPRKRVKSGDDIRQPGPPGPWSPSNAVATLSDHFAPLIADQADNLDAAVGMIVPPHGHDGNVVPRLPGIPNHLHGRVLGTPLPDEELQTGITVAKIGCATGWTEGARVSATDVSNVEVQFGAGGPVYLFNEVCELQWASDTSPFTAPGDSGAMVMTLDGLRPLGLHFCAATNEDGSHVSYIVPWSRIQTFLGVDWCL